MQQPTSRITQSIPSQNTGSLHPNNTGLLMAESEVDGTKDLISGFPHSCPPVPPNVLIFSKATGWKKMKWSINYRNCWTVTGMPSPNLYLGKWFDPFSHLTQGHLMQCSSPGRPTRQGPGQKYQWKPIGHLSKYLKVIHQANIVLNNTMFHSAVLTQIPS